MLVIASEDIGLAYPQCAAIVKACVDSAFQLGLPEARIPLAEAIILMATAPKSNSAINGIDAAIADIRAGRAGDIPAHLKDTHYGGAKKLGRGLTYQYPHMYPNPLFLKMTLSASEYPQSRRCCPAHASQNSGNRPRMPDLP